MNDYTIKLQVKVVIYEEIPSGKKKYLLHEEKGTSETTLEM